MDRSRLLNFKAGHIDRLPATFDISSIETTNAGLKVICGPGDYVHGGITNVEKYKSYDVFCCFGDEGISKETNPDAYTSVDENLQYLNNNKLNKVLCIIDVNSEDQTNNFASLFQEKCIQVNHQDGHSPIFDPITCFKLLKPGGIAVLKGTEGSAEITFFDKTYWKDKEGVKQFNCKKDSFLEPGTERQFASLKICTKRDYSPDLFGGKKRKTKKRHSKKIRKTRRRRR